MGCLYLLIIAATLWLLGNVVARLAIVVIPAAVALLLAALFAPLAARLAGWGVPRWLATLTVLLGGLGLAGGLGDDPVRGQLAPRVEPRAADAVLATHRQVEQVRRRMWTGEFSVGQRDALGEHLRAVDVEHRGAAADTDTAGPPRVHERRELVVVVRGEEGRQGLVAGGAHGGLSRPRGWRPMR